MILKLASDQHDPLLRGGEHVPVRTDTLETNLSSDTINELGCGSNSSDSTNGETFIVDLTSELDKNSNFSAKGIVLQKRLIGLSQAFVFPLYVMQTLGLIIGPCVPPPDSGFDPRLVFSNLRIDDPDVEKKLCPEKQARREAEAATVGDYQRRNSALIRRAECKLRQRTAKVVNPLGIVLIAGAFGYSIWGLSNAAREFNNADKLGVVFAIMNFMWIAEQLSVALLLRKAWSGPLKEIVWKWRTTKCVCVLQKQIICINRVSIITFSSGLLLVAVEVLIMASLVFELIPGTSKLFTHVLPQFDNATADFNLKFAAKCGFMLCASLLTAYSYLVPCLIILIAYVLCEEFERINQLLHAEYDRERRTLNVELALLRTWHQNICFLVDKCDEAFRMIIAVTAAVGVFNTVFVLYQICDSYQQGAASSVLWIYTFWLVGHVAKWLVVSLMCARVHEVAHRPLAILFNIDAKTYSPNVDDHNARLELLLFTGKLSSSLRIGITIGGVVALTRNTILSLFTFLLTLVLVMFQMKQKVF